MSAYVVLEGLPPGCQWHAAEAVLTNGNRILGVGSPRCPNTKVYAVLDKANVAMFLCRHHISVLEQMGAGPLHA